MCLGGKTGEVYYQDIKVDPKPLPSLSMTAGEGVTPTYGTITPRMTSKQRRTLLMGSMMGLGNGR